MKKKAKTSKASPAKATRIPKEHPAYNLPDPQGGAFDGQASPAQMSNPGVPMPPMPQGAMGM